MASPQVENGHLKIANEVWEQLTKFTLSGVEYSVIMAVIRKTWGWNEKESELSIAELCAMTCRPRSSITDTLKKLRDANILKNSPGGGRNKPSKWSFNKDWETWKTVRPTGQNKPGEIKSPVQRTDINSTPHRTDNVRPTGQFITVDRTVSSCNSLPGMEQLAPKATIKATKDKRGAKKAAPPDARRAPLKEFIDSEYRRLNGRKLITNSGDWKQFEQTLHDSATDPAFTRERLEQAWTAFLTSPDEFHRKQGHPLRYWASNINAFMPKCRAAPEPQLKAEWGVDAQGNRIAIIPRGA